MLPEYFCQQFKHTIFYYDHKCYNEYRANPSLCQHREKRKAVMLYEKAGKAMEKAIT